MGLVPWALLHRKRVAPVGGGLWSKGQLTAGTAVIIEELVEVLETLHRESSNVVSLPIKAHEERLQSSERAVSLAFLTAVQLFFERHGGLELAMGDVCKGTTTPVTVCGLTLSTGLSLAESVAH
eukprot:1094311-Prymnesium_polylepis.2